MLKMNKSAYKRRTRSDKGKPRKSRLTPEYQSHLGRCNPVSLPHMREPELLAILANGCELCGRDAVRVRGATPYCLQCDAVAGALGSEALAWVGRVALHRL